MDKAAAQQTVTTRTVLILTDVNNPTIFESPGLAGSIPAVDGVSAIAVIDHHRLVGELPFTPFLHYIEATKSSASEIMAEILQQSDYSETLYKEEANLLLAGIMLDTHNFTRSAGSQTFEARHLWFYIYDEDVPPARVYSPNIASIDNAPVGCSSLQAEVFYANDAPIPPAEEVLASTIEKLKSICNFTDEDIIVKDIRFEPYANVAFTHPIYENRQIVHDYLDSLGIEYIGRCKNYRARSEPNRFCH